MTDCGLCSECDVMFTLLFCCSQKLKLARISIIYSTFYNHSFVENIRCPFADKCIQAHSHEELEEWRERFKFKRQQLQMAKDKRLHGNTYPEQLMEKLLTAEYPKSVVSDDCFISFKNATV